MRIYCKEITLNTDKNVKDARIACFSDLHYSKKLGMKTLETIYKAICEYHPDYICFLGDLLNDDSFNEVYNFIGYLGCIAPVLLIDGNHDIESFGVDDKIHYNKNFFLNDELKKRLDNIPNVYYLTHNQTEHFDNISFTGTDFFHRSHENDWWDYLDSNTPVIDESSYNILLCHNPFIINRDTFSIVDDTYQNFDAAFTGHIHNALMPAYIDNMIKTNIGLFTVDTGFFPPDYLGEKEIKVDKDKSITRVNIPPIRTFNPENPLFNGLNKLYPPSIKLVRIKKN